MGSCREETGVECGGRSITNLRSADDAVLMATREEDLQTLLNRTITEGRKYGIELNEKKNKSHGCYEEEEKD